MRARRTRSLSEREKLLAWYDEHRRDLPWRRRQHDAYAVWVSEVMLQQTRVETVVPYYERFMSRFPTATALAAASEDEVLASWSGLGYYRRARLLHRGVREVVERYGGEVPDAAEARRALPGVGRYTAGAIGSIAFGKEEPIVDGNVARVLARLYAIDSPLGHKTTERTLWARAEEWVRGPRPGDLNQGLMELGASVCSKQQPRCGECPLAAGCRAREQGRAAELPVPKLKAAPKRVRLSAVVARRKSGAFVLVRSDGALFARLFGPPTFEGHDRDAARRALRSHQIHARLAAEPCARIEHVLSHRKLDVRVWRATAPRLSVDPSRRLVEPAEIHTLGVSTFARRVLEAAGQ